MSSLGVVHLVYKAQRALPIFCSLCTHSLIELFESEFGEPYKSVQEVYENAFRFRLFAMAWETSVRGLVVVHLLYKVIRDIPVWYTLCTHSQSALFRPDLGEPHRSVQEVYQNGVHCTLYSTSW